jgi:hypothetical protein
VGAVRVARRRPSPTPLVLLVLLVAVLAVLAAARGSGD